MAGNTNYITKLENLSLKGQAFTFVSKQGNLLRINILVLNTGNVFTASSMFCGYVINVYYRNTPFKGTVLIVSKY